MTLRGSVRCLGSDTFQPDGGIGFHLLEAGMFLTFYM